MENDRFHVVDFHQYVRCDDIEKIIAQRDELLAALKETRFAILVAVGRKSHVENALKMADSAIANCEVKS